MRWNLSGTETAGAADGAWSRGAFLPFRVIGSFLGPVPMAIAETELKRTPLFDVHLRHGAKMVPFAGYEMPVQFSEGVKAEHLWTRAHAGLFDVSHMGPCFLGLKSGIGADDAHARISAIIERVVPSDIDGLAVGQSRLTVLLNEQGGILDDLIVTRAADPANSGWLYIVVNGAVKEQDFALFEEIAGDDAEFVRADDGILFALQGPDAEAALRDNVDAFPELGFMQSSSAEWAGDRITVSRCGYTGEDGFEVFARADSGVSLVERLLQDPRVKPVGLGARDSLRLEAGLCLYGHDLDPSRDPVEADLKWIIQKSRRQRADFPGAGRILKALADGPAERRVGIRPLERAPAREGTEIQSGGVPVGHITSGGFGPSIDAPIAMGYVRADLATPGTPLELMVRGKVRPAEVAPLPFVPHRYKR
ncbi:MAG: glycine cleavage system aminomethyltransferase GcvT [Pseudomonadota bacterium]